MLLSTHTSCLLCTLFEITGFLYTKPELRVVTASGARAHCASEIVAVRGWALPNFVNGTYCARPWVGYSVSDWKPGKPNEFFSKLYGNATYVVECRLAAKLSELFVISALQTIFRPGELNRFLHQILDELLKDATSITLELD